MRLNCVFGTRTTFDLLLWWCADTSSCSRICWPTSSKSNSRLEVLSGNLTFLYKCTSFAGNLSAQASSVKRSCFSPPCCREPLQGSGLQEGVTQSFCRVTDTISAYINHIGTARPPGARWGDSFMAHLQNATCQSAESDRYQRAGPPHCHTDRSCCGGLFSKRKTVMIYRLPAPSCSYTAGLQLYEIRIISRCLSAGGAFVAWWHQALSALLFQL